MKLPLFLFAIFSIVNINGQDPSFSMGSENQIYINPAFTGTINNMRAGLSYRNQWPGISGTYITTNAYFDKHIGKWGGLGVKYTHDNAASTLKSDYVYLNYAYQIKIKENGVLSLGLELGYIQKSLDWSKLTFGDMISDRRGFVYQTGDMPRGGNVYNIDIGAGVLYYDNIFFSSFSIHHINQPNQSLIGGTSRLPIMFNYFGGAKLNIGELAILPQVDIKCQDNFISTVGWLKWQYKFVQFGIGDRLNDAMLFTLGGTFDVGSSVHQIWDGGYIIFGSTFTSPGNPDFWLIRTM